MNTSPPSYWQDTAFRPPSDLLIIGAGLTGLCCAYHYLRRYPGHAVTILEKGPYSAGASVKNAGFACFGSPGELMADMAREDEKVVVERVEKRIRGLEGLRQIVTDDEMDFREKGGYEIFTDQESYHRLLAGIRNLNASLAQTTGMETTFEPASINGYQAFFCRVEGVLHSGKLINRLIKIVQDLGARLITGADAVSITTGKVFLKSETRPLVARKIIAATNGYTSSLFPELKIKPARGYVFVTHPLPKLSWRHSFHYYKGFVYFRNIGNRLLIGGARHLDPEAETTYQDGINPGIKSWLVHFTNHILKIGDDWRIDYEWSGIMGFTENKNPLAVEVEKDVFVLGGYSGMGVSMAFESARELVSKIDGQSDKNVIQH